MVKTGPVVLVGLVSTWLQVRSSFRMKSVDHTDVTPVLDRQV